MGRKFWCLTDDGLTAICTMSAAADEMLEEAPEDRAIVALLPGLVEMGIGQDAAASTMEVLLGRADDSSAPVAVEAEAVESGYITRDGKFYACEYFQHPALARRLFLVRGEDPEDPQKAADEAGWLRIQKSAFGGWQCSITKRPSDRQRHSWEEWALINHVEIASLNEFTTQGDTT